MLSYAAMKRLLILAFVLFALPAAAGEKTPLGEYLDTLPPMNSLDRAAFDKAARSVYREDCNCLTFLLNGKRYGIKIPLSDSDRRLLIEGFKHNILVPLPESGQSS